ncbi:hypothetical protein CXB51_034168 [Gossypium anomalum]|uniref:Uncharacterized protein n=1 Tax=Gossypium anomalum TaxID=47600 RepID=A0A8J5Y3S4_9ROSI|nr:hypothetical protein CXB51_034168 [Gossypium anomalum]
MFAKQVWLRLNYQLLVLVVDSSFNEWLSWLFEKLASNKKDEITITIWRAEHGRSDYLHQRLWEGTSRFIVNAATPQAKRNDMLESRSSGLEGHIMGLGFRVHNLVKSSVMVEATALLHGIQFA